MKQPKKFYAKGIAYGCTLAMAFTMLTGCNVQTNSKATAASESTSSEDLITVQVTKVDGSTVTADQGEWNGPGLTKKQDREKPDGNPPDNGSGGEKPDGNPPDGNGPGGEKPDGNPPDNNGSDQNTEKSSDQDTDVSSGSSSAKDHADHPAPDDDSTDDQTPDGNASEDNKTDGNPPQQDGKMGSPFTSSGESISFTVTDDTQIVARSRDGEEEKSLSDITEGSILQIELDDDGQAAKITIMPAFGGGHGGPK